MSDRLVIDDLDDTASIALRGEIDAHTAPSLDAHFDSLPPGTGDVTIDMSEVTFMDSSGLRILIAVDQRFGDVARRLVVRNPSHAVIRLFDVTGLADHFTVLR